MKIKYRECALANAIIFKFPLLDVNSEVEFLINREYVTAASVREFFFEALIEFCFHLPLFAHGNSKKKYDEEEEKNV